MEKYEKLGLFYLGKVVDEQKRTVEDDLVLLKSKDLTTHAVIIGMTGSGKTGLGISLIEEAMMDNIPVIANDPKGDLANIALTFPKLRAEDFRPWINVQEASNKGVTPEEYAEVQANLWKNGLADWGQDSSRIETLQRTTVNIYTPGGSGGIGVSVLKSFSAPTPEIIADREAYRDKINVTTTSLLSLIGIEANPLTSREFILISNIFEFNWTANKALSLSELITQIQKPPIDKVGVLDLESFYASKERFTLAMMLNNLLASPGFEAWMEGETLDINGFMYGSSGKPQVSVFSIAHLSDSERMFFVTMLLSEVLTWVRSQPGTSSLRALFYMDEIFGYLPPTANPPSKSPMLTLLKQARAFGLGLVLSTQNPVDLDYKALSNAGTWFIGRLQTQRDKERVIAGLEGAASEGKFDKSRTEQILASLGQRIFYLHSVHEDEPIIFNTRWAMSYLAGPMTKEQLLKLPKREVTTHGDVSNQNASIVTKHRFVSENGANLNTIPVLSPQIKQVFLPPQGRISGEIVYNPYVIGVTDVLYNNAKNNVSITKSYTLVTPIHEGPVPIDWEESKTIDLGPRELGYEPLEGASYAPYPEAVASAKNYDSWKRMLNQHIRTSISLQIYACPGLKTISQADEDERSFKIRIQHVAHEKRDEDLEAMKKKFDVRMQTLENRLTKANQALEKQNALSSQKKLDALVSAGSAVLGAFLGKKTGTASSVSKIGTAVRRTSTAMMSGQGIDQAKENVELLQAQLDEIQVALQGELNEITMKYDQLIEKIETINIRPTSENITIHFIGLAWVPTNN